MGPSEWTAAILFMLTIASSAVSVTLYLGRRHAEIVQKMGEMKLEMTKIEQAWADRLAEAIAGVHAKINDGPSWLRELMEAQQELLRQSITNGQIALDVAKQHGEEMVQLTTRVASVENGQKRIEERLDNLRANHE